MTYSLLALMTLAGAWGSFFLKKAADSSGARGLFRSFHFYCGGVIYFGSALINIMLLRAMQFSVVLLCTSATYIWTLLISKFLLGEKIGTVKIVSMLLIFTGIALILV